MADVGGRGVIALIIVAMQVPFGQLPHGRERAGAYFEDPVGWNGVLHWA